VTREPRDPALTPRLLAGLLIALFGVAMLGDNLGWFDAGRLWRVWPLALIAIGIAKVAQDRDHGNRVGGWILIGLGALFATETMVFFRFDVWRWWPLAIVIFGVMIIGRAVSRPAPPPPGPAPGGASGQGFPGAPPLGGRSGGTAVGASSSVAGITDSKISDVAIWSGLERRITSSTFKHADLTAVMGGIDLDLRQASTDTGQAVVDVFVLWGGIEITVPPDWAVQNEVTPIMGGAEDKSTGTQQARHRLIVRGVVIMGGVDIKT
jgi:hypothetical protein